MYYFLILIFSIAIISYSTVNAESEETSQEFCYNDPKCSPGSEVWGGKCKTGKYQSPINIPCCAKGKEFKSAELKFNREYLMQNYQRFYASNNEVTHRVEFQLDPDVTSLASNLTAYGGMLDASYNFGQLNFHWGRDNSNGSEHSLCEKKFPLEMHIVHYQKKFGSLSKALTSDDHKALYVVGILFKIGAHNKAMKPIIDALSKLRTPGKVMEFKDTLPIIDLYPTDRRFARYLGSVTTPPCDENVIWTFFIKPLEISKNQMEKFHEINNAKGKPDLNFRPIQPLYGRHVKFYDGRAAGGQSSVDAAAVVEFSKESIVNGWKPKLAE